MEAKKPDIEYVYESEMCYRCQGSGWDEYQDEHTTCYACRGRGVRVYKRPIEVKSV